jgi:hypothetical protein
MEVVTLLLFIGAVWVIAAIGFFAWNLLATTDHEHADRLALLPLEGNWSDPQKCPPRDDAP